MKKMLFDLVYIYEMYLNCRRHKRNSLSAFRFEDKLEHNLVNLYELLISGDYKPKAAIAFVTSQPKFREIIAADFADRIVHHLIVSRLEKIYEPIFIYDSYACRKNKGVHAAVDRVQYFVRKMISYDNNNLKGYYLHKDIKSFFLNIDKRILLQLVRIKLHKAILKPSHDLDYLATQNPFSLIKTVLYSQNNEETQIKGNIELYNKMPVHKSLLKKNNKNVGLPIGNLTSQFFANVYLNELDQFVKHTLKCRSYIRYCDDFILIDKSQIKLNDFKVKITDFLNQQLKLVTNTQYGQIRPIKNGIDCLGYIVHPNYRLIRNRTVHNFERKLSAYKSFFERQGSEIYRLLNMNSKNITTAQTVTLGNKEAIVYLYAYQRLAKLHAIIASYLGIFSHADSYRLKVNIFNKNKYLYQYYDRGILEESYFTKLKALFNFKKAFKNIYQQYFYFKKLFNPATILFQVGNAYHFYEVLNDKVLSCLELSFYDRYKKLKGYFAQDLLSKNIALLLKGKNDFVLIKELPYRYNTIKVRMPLLYAKT